MTTFKVEIDEDEVMPELMEQCALVGLPPRVFLSALIEDVLIRAREEGLQLHIPAFGPPPTSH